tara:strand:+ start:158 stop:1108 length:951 start_codon:yes stop_codon:yes gene_type:complete
MKQPILSIIVPTRDNIENLEDGFLKSVIINTNNINNIELVFVVDEDDKKTIDFLSNNQALKELTFLQILKRKRSNNITEDYYNYGAKKSYGFFVMPGADDIQIDTPNYDLILIKTREGMIKTEGVHKKHYLLIKTFGKGNAGAGFCCFPILTRASIDLLGYFLAPPAITGWGADWFIDKIYSTVNKVAVPTTPINIQHVSKHSGDITQTAEARYSRMAAISQAVPNCKHNPKIYVEMVKAIFLIIAENMEQYTPAAVYEDFSNASATPDTQKAANISHPKLEKHPKIFLEAIYSIKQAVYNNRPGAPGNLIKKKNE